MNAPMVNVLAKARRFADFLQQQLGPILDLETVHDMRLWGDAEWQRVTDWMNERERIGKPETIPTSSREAIIVILQERLAPKPVFDPLEGLPR